MIKNTLLVLLSVACVFLTARLLNTHSEFRLLDQKRIKIIDCENQQDSLSQLWCEANSSYNGKHGEYKNHRAYINGWIDGASASKIGSIPIRPSWKQGYQDAQKELGLSIFHNSYAQFNKDNPAGLFMTQIDSNFRRQTFANQGIYTKNQYFAGYLLGCVLAYTYPHDISTLTNSQDLAAYSRKNADNFISNGQFSQPLNKGLRDGVSYSIEQLHLHLTSASTPTN